MMQKAHGDIIDFAQALMSEETNIGSMVKAYLETTKKVEAIGTDMIDYIQICLKKRGVQIDREYILDIFTLGGFDAMVTHGEK